MPNMDFFKKKNVSSIVLAGGPTPGEQLLAMAENRYWTVLNASFLTQCNRGDSTFMYRTNAFKSALQTYGPIAKDKLPSCPPNKGKAEGIIFHGHINDSNGTTYVLEWTVINTEKRLIALLGFDTHENYKFKQTPLNKDMCSKISSAPENVKIMSHVSKKIAEAKAKVERVEQNYRHVPQ